MLNWRTKCRRIQADFQAFLDGTLSDGGTQMLSAHLENCDRCHQAFVRFRRSDALLQGYFGEVNHVHLPDGFWARLRGRLDTREVTQDVHVWRPAQTRWRWQRRAWVPIGGVIGLIVVGLFWHAIHLSELRHEQWELEQIRKSILHMEAEMERPVQG